MQHPSLCPCGSTHPYEKCCEPFHLKQSSPPTAEALMRSRYSAYVKKHYKYLWETTLPKEREPGLLQSIEQFGSEMIWLKLEVLSTSQGLEGDKRGKVEFKAHYKNAQGQAGIHHEHSRFKRFEGKWHYWDGVQKSDY